MQNAAKKSAPQLGLAIRSQFPIFSQNFEKPLAYLDTAASSQKSQSVISRLNAYLSYEHANIHRGAYALSATATENYEAARRKVAKFIGADDERCVIFTRSTTEAINLVSYSFEKYFKAGDVILLSMLEHHSNIVPWQLLAQRAGVKLAFVEIDKFGQLSLSDLKSKLSALKPKLLAITHIANSLGSYVPLDEVASLAKLSGAKILVDAAQSAAHMALDVHKLDLDFLAFSGHKFYGPTGIGVLYGKRELLEQMQPFMGGGDMIERVSIEGSTWAEIPAKFEAGTPPIAEAIALGTAVDFVQSLNLENIAAHEDRLLQAAFEMLSAEPEVELYGPIMNGGKQCSILSFNVKGVHAHDVATVADSFNLQLRSGHHCAMPTLHKLGIPSSARISFGVYSDLQDLEILREAVRETRKLFK